MAKEVRLPRNLFCLCENWTKNYAQGSQLFWRMTYGDEPADIIVEHNLDYDRALEEAYWALLNMINALGDPEATIRSIIDLFSRIEKLRDVNN